MGLSGEVKVDLPKLDADVQMAEIGCIYTWERDQGPGGDASRAQCQMDVSRRTCACGNRLTR